MDDPQQSDEQLLHRMIDKSGATRVLRARLEHAEDAMEHLITEYAIVRAYAAGLGAADDYLWRKLRAEHEKLEKARKIVQDFREIVDHIKR